jgi:hypothetical protein
MQTIILNDNEVEVDGVKYIKESKPKYEIGKWYHYGGECPSETFRVNKIDRKFVYYDVNNQFSLGSTWDKQSRLATKEEIKEHLSKVCQKKYVGKRIFNLSNNKIATVVAEDYKDGETHSWYYNIETDIFNVAAPKKEWDISSNPVVYKQGTWATIVPDKKKLPKTKTEFIDFLQHWEAGSDNTMREFLNDYED